MREDLIDLFQTLRSASVPSGGRGREPRPGLRPSVLVLVQPRLPGAAPDRLVDAGQHPRKDHPLRGGARDQELGRSAPPHRAGRPALLRLLPSGARRRAADLRRGRADAPRSPAPSRPLLQKDARPDRAEAGDHGGVLFDLELPAGARRRLLRQFPDQAGGRGAVPRDPDSSRPSSRSRRCRASPPGSRASAAAERRRVHPAEDRRVLCGARRGGLGAGAGDRARRCASRCMRPRPIISCAPRPRRGRPVDPVARFHLGNGARLERHRIGSATRRRKGLAQSHGLMVNYLYDLDDIERNHEAFAEQGEVVAASSAVRQAAARPTAPSRDVVRCQQSSTLKDAVMADNLFDARPPAHRRRPARPSSRPPTAGCYHLWRTCSTLSARIANALVDCAASSPATASPCRSRRAPRRSCSISPACGPARSTCRSTPPTRSPSSNISSATPSRALVVCDPAKRRGAAADRRRSAASRASRRSDADGDGSLHRRSPTRARRRVSTTSRASSDDLAAILYTSGTTGPLQGRDADARQPRLERR